MSDEKTRLASIKQSNSDALSEAMAIRDAEIKKLCDKICLEITEKHRENISRLSSNYYQASEDLDRYINENATHKWEGKKVYGYTYGRSYRMSKTKVFGLVEVCRYDTEFPRNLSSHSTPALGEAFVRKLKKDGSVGKQVSHLYGWKLVDGEPS